MTGHLGEADLARLERSGILAPSSEQGLEPRRRSWGRPALVAAGAAGSRGAARRRATGVAAGSDAWAGTRPGAPGAAAGGAVGSQLREAPESEWEAIVLELVRGQVASVLGHTSGDAVDPQRNFKDAGFDSLAAVSSETA